MSEFEHAPQVQGAIGGGVSDGGDRAHDIGLRLVPGMESVAFDIYVGGGLGRTPVVAPECSSRWRLTICCLT